jgi:hypothetical protein
LKDLGIDGRMINLKEIMSGYELDSSDSVQGLMMSSVNMTMILEVP